MPIISTFFRIVIRMFYQEWNASHRWSSSMTLLPGVISAEYRGGHRIRVTFSDGSEKTIDFRAWLRGPVFEPLKDEAYFSRFFVEGGTVAWPNGADIAPETLYESHAINEAA